MKNIETCLQLLSAKVAQHTVGRLFSVDDEYKAPKIA